MTALWIILAATGGSVVGAGATIARLPYIVAAWTNDERARFARTVNALAKD